MGNYSISGDVIDPDSDFNCFSVGRMSNAIKVIQEADDAWYLCFLLGKAFLFFE